MTPRVAHIAPSSPAPLAIMAKSSMIAAAGPVAIKAANDVDTRGAPTLLVRRRRRHGRRVS